MQVFDNEATKMKYEAAIVELSKHVTRTTDGVFELHIKDAQEIGMDQNVFYDLSRSLEMTNELIRRGMINADEIQFT
jgi:hypothetical protein